ncbi:MAG: YdbH domain-containing protein [Alphaproteobacteria bacterium]
MIRRLGIAVAVVVAVLAVALGAAFVFRTELAARLLLAKLSQLGVPAARLTVGALDTHHLRLTGVSLGAAGELRVDAVTVLYSLAGLRAGRLDRVRLEGPVLRADFTAAAAPFGSLEPLLGGAGGGASPRSLPAIDIERGRIEADSPLGALVIDLEGELRPAGDGGLDGGPDGGLDGGLDAALSVALESRFARLTGIAGVAVRPGRLLTAEFLIDDGALTLPGAEIGGLTGAVDVSLGGAWPPSFAQGWVGSIGAELALSDLALRDTRFEAARLSLSMSGDTITLEATVREAGERLAAAFSARLEDGLKGPRLELELEASLSAEAELWRALDLAPPEAGRARVSLDLRGAVPPLAGLWGAVPPPARLWGERGAATAWLAASTLAGRAHLVLEGLAYAGWVEGLEASLGAEVGLESGVLSLTPATELRLRAARLAPEALDAIGVPAELRPLIERELSLVFSPSGVPIARITGLPGAPEAELVLDGAVRLSAAGGLAVSGRGRVQAHLGEAVELGEFELPRVTLALPALTVAGQTLSGARFAGAVEGRAGALRGRGRLDVELPRITFNGLNIDLFSARLPLSFEFRARRIAARLEAPGTVRVGALWHQAGLRPLADLELQVPAATLTLELPAGVLPGVTLEHTISLAPSDLELEIDRQGGPALEIAARSGKITLAGRLAPGQPYGGELTIAEARLALPQYDLDLDDIAATVTLGAGHDAPLARFTIGALRHTAEPALVAPLRLEGEIVSEAEGVALTALGGARDSAWQVAVSARHDLERGGGRAELRLDALSFHPRRLQPADLSPLLADLGAVSGAASAVANLAWSRQGVDGTAEVELKDLSFTIAGIGIEGLDTRLRFSSLWPPSTPPGQMVRVRAVDLGLALHDLSLRLSLPSGDVLRVLVERAETSFAGGNLAVVDALFEPRSPRQRLVLFISALDLERLFELVEVEGLSGSGTISGAIPVAFGEDTVVIREGRLGATGPGVIRYRSARAAAALESGGKAVDLMLRALQDFRYQELSVTIDKAANEDLFLVLHILGHNPEVLEGYPFAINITLSANIASLLAALRAGTALAKVLIRRLPESP